ncbi:MAG: EpsI family protein [Phenylobacterium zucineum]|nr:MAG: EpsI family protein [Phenylobacterium zucineum]
MRRRDLILGGMAVTALGASEYLRPRKRLTLLKKGDTIEATIPMNFGVWEGEKVSDLVGPEQAGRLARSLYSETVARVYVDSTTGAMVMLLAAYGDTQSDLLQLHRPESCYPAVGFKLDSAESVDLKMAGGAVLPVRRVVASTEQRVENIVYWTRMGETLPQTGGQQRVARLENAIQGYVPDGILVRVSVLGEAEKAFPIADRFVADMLRATPRDRRAALIGTDLGRRIA